MNGLFAMGSWSCWVSTIRVSLAPVAHDSLTPRIGIQYDANARTRLRAAYAPGGEEGNIQSVAAFERRSDRLSEMPNKRPIAFVDGRAVMDRSHRLEFGIERVIDNKSNLEGTAFFDTTSGRGVGLAQHTDDSVLGCDRARLLSASRISRAQSRGMRLVYTRRLSRMWTASGGYSFGRGQRLASGDISQPTEIFESGFFQTRRTATGRWFRHRHEHPHRLALLAKRDRVCNRSFCRASRCL